MTTSGIPSNEVRRLSTSSQALHILRKDVAQFRWLIVAGSAELIACVLLSTFVASTNMERIRVPGLFATVGWSLMTVVLTGVLLAAVVQSDSPTASESYWRATPSSSDSIVLAKLLLILGGVTLGCAIAQIATLSALDVPMEAALPLVFRQCLVLMNSLMSLMVLAAVTPGIVMFAVAVVAISLANGQLWSTETSQLRMPATWDAGLIKSLLIIPFLVNLIVFRQLYARHFSPRAARLLVASVIVCVPLAQIGLTKLGRTLLPDEHVTSFSEQGRPSISATQSIDGITVRVGIRAPSDSFQFTILRAAILIRIADRAVDTVYPLGAVTFSSCGQAKSCEDVQAVRVSPGAGMINGASSVRVRDSIFVSLNYPLRDSPVTPHIQLSNVEFRGDLVVQKRVVRLDVAADTSTVLQGWPGVRIDPAPRDSAYALTLAARSLTMDRNPASWLIGFASWNPRSLRYKSLGMYEAQTDTLRIISRGGTDTVSLAAFSGSGFSSFLPVPNTGLSIAHARYQRDSVTARVDLKEFVKGARLVITGWDYHGRSLFHSTFANPQRTASK